MGRNLSDCPEKQIHKTGMPGRYAPQARRSRISARFPRTYTDYPAKKRPNPVPEPTAAALPDRAIRLTAYADIRGL
jgi:hypothetical protein